ncbi:MAG: hypothetical protein GX557_04125, partial [Chloroflexi bacterium]|nr:hypothetical protein [Chloroflexota bacterium]
IDGDSEARSKIGVERMIAIANEYGVPVLVDAAAQPLHVPNRYLQMGASAVAYSGGKCLRGPQSTGLVLGNKNLLWAAFQNASPHGSQGRGMKVGKEDIMALLGAVEAFVLGRDHAAEWKMWEGYLETIRKAVADIPSVTTEIEQPGVCNVTPYLLVRWDPAVVGATSAQIQAALMNGDPSILINGMPDGLRCNPYMLEDGEAAIVAKHLRQCLLHPPAAPVAAPAAAPTVDVTGEWTINIQFLASTSVHTLKIAQTDGEFSGVYRSQYNRCEVGGRVTGDTVTFRVTMPVGMFRPTYEFNGKVSGDSMSGKVSIGQEWPATFTAPRPPPGQVHRRLRAAPRTQQGGTMTALPRRVYDLSEPLYHNCPGNPAFPPMELSVRTLHATVGWCTEELRMYTHIGTHIDAPYHRLAEGATLDAVPLERLVCGAVCVSAEQVAPGASIGCEVLGAAAEQLTPGMALIIRTGWGDKRANTAAYYHESPWVSAELAEWAVAHRLAGVGIDHFSIGGTQPDAVAVPHEILLRAGLWIVEGLSIPPELVPLPSFLLVVAPLRLVGTSGAPARALALVF